VSIRYAEKPDVDGVVTRIHRKKIFTLNDHRIRQLKRTRFKSEGELHWRNWYRAHKAGGQVHFHHPSIQNLANHSSKNKFLTDSLKTRPKPTPARPAGMQHICYKKG
jgi:hypothetical protein